MTYTPWYIHDAPRFPHRELLIDSSRHFLPVPALKQIIDSLPYAKINVLHWHIVDNQSFPRELLPNGIHHSLVLAEADH